MQLGFDAKQASNTGTWGREAGGPETVRVTPDDPKALADALVTVLTDTARRASMIKAGREHAAKFKAGDLAEKVMHIYHDVSDDPGCLVSSDSPLASESGRAH